MNRMRRWMAARTGLDAYRGLAELLPRLLRPGGMALLELGPGQARIGGTLVPEPDSRPCRTRFGRDSAGFGAEKAKIGLGKPPADD